MSNATPQEPKEHRNSFMRRNNSQCVKSSEKKKKSDSERKPQGQSQTRPVSNMAHTDRLMNHASEPFLNMQHTQPPPLPSMTSTHDDFRSQIQEMKDNLYKQKAKFEQNMMPSNGYKGLASEQPSPAAKKKPEMHLKDLGPQKESIQHPLKENGSARQSNATESFDFGGSQFAQEFALMKKMIIQFQTKFKSQNEKIGELQNQVTKLAHVNLKLNADNKIIRGEHDALKHRVQKLERLVQQSSAALGEQNQMRPASAEMVFERMDHERRQSSHRDSSSARNQQRPLMNTFEEVLNRKVDNEERESYAQYKKRDRDLAEQTLSSTEARQFGGEVLVDQILRKHEKASNGQSNGRYDDMMDPDLRAKNRSEAYNVEEARDAKLETRMRPLNTSYQHKNPNSDLLDLDDPPRRTLGVTKQNSEERGSLAGHYDPTTFKRPTRTAQMHRPPQPVPHGTEKIIRRSSRPSLAEQVKTQMEDNTSGSQDFGRIGRNDDREQPLMVKHSGLIPETLMMESSQVSDSQQLSDWVLQRIGPNLK